MVSEKSRFAIGSCNRQRANGALNILFYMYEALIVLSIQKVNSHIGRLKCQRWTVSVTQ